MSKGGVKAKDSRFVISQKASVTVVTVVTVSFTERTGLKSPFAVPLSPGVPLWDGGTVLVHIRNLFAEKNLFSFDSSTEFPNFAPDKTKRKV